MKAREAMPLAGRETFVVGSLTVVLWLLALFLWSASTIASGVGFSALHLMMLVQTALLGLPLSVVLALVIVLSRPLGTLLTVAIVGSAALLLALAHTYLDALLLQRLYIQLGVGETRVGQLFARGLMLFMLIYAFYAAALCLGLASIAVRAGERHLAHARNSAQQAKIAALRFQLNPHFLFNTLNAISALIVTGRNGDAERMTVKLSEFLRISLESDPEAEVTLDEELATTQSYLDIEAVRFPQRLKTEFQCPAALLGASVPSFLLQPLVENAVKYAVAPSRHTVTLSVHAKAALGTLTLTVEDDGRQAFGALPPGGTGLGLANISKRLDAFYGPLGTLEATATERGFIVTIQLPLRYEQVVETAA
jgi:signal transduction histidine kinase